MSDHAPSPELLEQYRNENAALRESLKKRKLTIELEAPDTGGGLAVLTFARARSLEHVRLLVGSLGFHLQREEGAFLKAEPLGQALAYLWADDSAVTSLEQLLAQLGWASPAEAEPASLRGAFFAGWDAAHAHRDSTAPQAYAVWFRVAVEESRRRELASSAPAPDTSVEAQAAQRAANTERILRAELGRTYKRIEELEAQLEDPDRFRAGQEQDRRNLAAATFLEAAELVEGYAPEKGQGAVAGACATIAGILRDSAAAAAAGKPLEYPLFVVARTEAQEVELLGKIREEERERWARAAELAGWPELAELLRSNPGPEISLDFLHGLGAAKPKGGGKNA